MSSWIDQGGFADVAECLLETHTGEVTSEDDLWKCCEIARYRAAVSRAYYAVFQQLKRRVAPARLGWRFPEHNVHAKVRRAVEEVLGTNHYLATTLLSLLRKRNRADYDLEHSFSRSEAESLLDDAHDAIDVIEGLNPDELRAIANAMYDLDRSGPGDRVIPRAIGRPA
jgi:uncharacterized protein (UPF0332 family)